MAWTYAAAYGPVGLVDNKGNAQTGAEVEVYDIGTTTLATLWKSRDKSTQADNPVDVDSNGNVTFFADPGRYDAVVRRDGIKLYEYEIQIPPDSAEPHVELHKPGGADDLSGTFEQLANKNVANGYAGLDGSTQVPFSRLPFGSGTYEQAANKNTANGYAGLDGNTEVPYSRLPFDSGTYAQAQRSSIVAGIGSGGDYATINAALDDIADRFFIHSNPSFDVELQLLDGFVVAEQLFTTADLSRFRFTQESGSIVSIDRSAITTVDPSGENTEPVFHAYDGGKLPIVDCMFDLDSSGSLGSTRVFKVRNGAWLYIKPSAGCSGQADRLVEVSHGARGIAPEAIVKDGPNIGVRVSNAALFNIGNGVVSGCDFNLNVGGSLVVANSADLSGAGTDGTQSQGSRIEMESANVSGAGRYGLYAHGAGSVRFDSGDATSAGQSGIFSERGAQVDASGANARKGASDDPSDVVVGEGGIVNATGLTGGVSQTANKVTGSGVVFDDNESAAADLPVDLGDPHGWGTIEGSPTFGAYTSPVAGVLDRQSMQPLADGTRERAAMPLFIPATAPSWKLRVYWVYAGTATGDVVITGHIPSSAVQNQGDAFANESQNIVLNSTTTDPAQDVLQVSEGTTETTTGFLNMALGTWGTGTLGAGERIHILAAEIVEA